MTKRRPLVMGNWKLNGSKEFTVELLTGLKAELAANPECEVVVAPPALYVSLAVANAGEQIAVGAQNCDIHLQGAFTGETSVAQLKDCGVKYVIIGHSERRQYHAESDAYIAQKFDVIKKEGLVPVLCIGETEEENEKGLTETVIKTQLNAVIEAYGAQAFEGSVIAYEPVWAIGTGKSATPDQAQAVHAFIRNYLASFNAEVAAKVQVLYGGSVNDANAQALFGQPDIDGALVGGASLKAPAFATIVKAAAACKA